MEIVTLIIIMEILFWNKMQTRLFLGKIKKNLKLNIQKRANRIRKILRKKEKMRKPRWVRKKRI